MHSRWIIALAGVVTQMMLGTVYAWSIFKQPMMAAGGWQEWQVGMTFTLAIASLGMAAALGGRWVDRSGASRVALVAAGMFGVGNLLAALAAQTGSIWLLWLGYGVLGGLGNGLGYVTPIAVLARWFPDKRALVTGMAVMGFGLGAAAVALAGPAMVGAWGVGGTFVAMGLVILAGLALASRRLVNPPQGYVPPGAQVRGLACEVLPSVAPRQAWSSWQFYILWGLLLLNVTAGIALISNLSPMAQQQLGIDAAQAAAVVVAGSICNGLGRLAWAALAQRIGGKWVFVLLLATQAPLLAALPMVREAWLFAAICCYVLLCYGGGFGTMPSFVTATFGPKHLGSIYGSVLLAWSLAGALGPGLMEWIKQVTGSFSAAPLVAAGLVAAGLVLALAYRRPAFMSAPAAISQPLDKPQAV
jgi:OFA family oxalate/formate antiporter-like MFS transporter